MTEQKGVQKPKYLRTFSRADFYLPLAATGGLSAEDRPELTTASVVVRFPRKHGKLDGAPTFWPHDESFLQAKKKSKDEWERKLAGSLLELIATKK
jgi:hypothetical protein